MRAGLGGWSVLLSPVPRLRIFSWREGPRVLHLSWAAARSPGFSRPHCCTGFCLTLHSFPFTEKATLDETQQTLPQPTRAFTLLLASVTPCQVEVTAVPALRGPLLPPAPWSCGHLFPSWASRTGVMHVVLTSSRPGIQGHRRPSKTNAHHFL